MIRGMMREAMIPAKCALLALAFVPAFQTARADGVAVNCLAPPTGDQIGASQFLAGHDTYGFGKEGLDFVDAPWSDAPSHPFPKWLRAESAPYGDPLRIDDRPIDSLTPFHIELVGVGGGITTDNHLAFEIVEPLDGPRIDYHIEVTIWGDRSPASPYFESTHFLSALVASNGFTATWSLTNIPNEHVYGSVILTPLALPDQPEVVDFSRAGTNLSVEANVDAGAHRIEELDASGNWQTDSNSTFTASAPTGHVWTVGESGSGSGAVLYRLKTSLY